MNPRPAARTAALLALFVLEFPAAAERRRAALPETVLEPTFWSAPSCATVTGLPSIRFTADLGDTASSNDRSPSLNTRPHDLVATDIPNVLYAAFEDAIYESRDAGCSWAKRIIVPGLGFSSVGMVTSHGGRTFAWNNTDSMLVRIRPEGDDVVELPERVAAIGVDRSDASRMIAISMLGMAYASADGGDTWTARAKATNGVVIAAAFSPRDLDRIVVSTSAGQVAQSRDGGNTWSVTSSPNRANVWSVAFSPVDSNVIWLQGLGAARNETIYRSIDGGATFAPVLSASPQIPFNRRRLSPHPSDRDLVAFGSWNNLIVLNGASGSTRIGAMRFAWDVPIWSPAGGVLYLLGADIVALP